MINNHYYCIIMAGGAGTRFWPISRTSCPKQFLDIAGTGETFLKKTYERFAEFIPKENILVSTTSRYRDLVMEQLPEIDSSNILVEPYARDTAPCITYATYTLLKRDPEAVMVVSPSDHLIREKEMFRKSILDSLEYAKKHNVLMTLGIVPTRPDTNFGYIQVTGGKGACKSDRIIPVKTFTEKPDAELAKVFIETGEFFWNSGIFVWTAETIKEELEKYLPEVTQLFNGWQCVLGSTVEDEFIEKAYTDCIKISIDYAVMEKTDKAWLYPAKFRWYDIGAWESLYDFYGHKDKEGNAFIAAKTLSDKDKGNLVISKDSHKLMAIKGLENFMVIDTDDVLLICPKDDKQFKDFVSGIAMPGFEDYR